MLKLQVKATGDSEADLELALEETLTQLRQGFTSGMGSNESGSYHFDVAQSDA